MEQPRMENRAMTFDEASMERSKSFVKALQELKNLRPQLYSAAEYCEKSFLHSEQKQMVLDNLKDYTLRSLVNAIDHLGTVAYKLTDLLEQQSLDVTVMELKVTSISQQVLTCQTYTENEGLRQQQLLAIIPRHHKHYILPNSVSKKVHFSPQIQTDARQKLQARSRLQPSGAPSAKTLSWHLASETKSSMKGNQHTLTSPEASGKMQVFQLLNDEDSSHSKSLVAPPQLRSGISSSGSSVPPHVASRKDSMDGSRSMTAFRSFDNNNQNKMAIIRAPARSRSMLSAFFAKPKAPRLRA